MSAGSLVRIHFEAWVAVPGGWALWMRDRSEGWLRACYAGSEGRNLAKGQAPRVVQFRKVTEVTTETVEVLP